MGDNGHQKGGKARFDHVYNQADPRLYFQTLQAHEYETPAHGQGVFTALVARHREVLGREDVSVLDLCCSYGVNAALLNHHITLDTLYQRYRSPELAYLSTEELAAADRVFFAERRRESLATVVGVDTADKAVAYAVQAGLLVAGDSVNLETDPPDEDLARHLLGIDLITVTGGIGYISERSFEQVLRRAAQPPWVAAFALRWVRFEPIAEVLATHGLVTEKLTSHTFPQRRFADEAERDYVLGELARMGIDPTDKESEGRYHAELYVARPAFEARRAPLEELLTAAV